MVGAGLGSKEDVRVFSLVDGETLLRTLMAWHRGEPRVCAMTVPPTPNEEDRRRVSRERATLQSGTDFPAAGLL